MKYLVMHYSNWLKPIGWHSSWEYSNNDTTETSLEFIHSCICNFQKIFDSMYRRIHSRWCSLSRLQKLIKRSVCDTILFPQSTPRFLHSSSFGLLLVRSALLDIFFITTKTIRY